MKKNYFILCMLLIGGIAFAQKPIMRPTGNITLPAPATHEMYKKADSSQETLSLRSSQNDDVIFSEDFQGTYTEENDYLPAGWAQYDFDDYYIPGELFGYKDYLFPSEWMAISLNNQPNNQFMASFSYMIDEYGAEAGAYADDWLVSPAIDLSNVEGAMLSFKAMSLNTDYFDEVQIWIIKDADYAAISTKTSANLQANSTQVYTSSSVPASWTSHEVEIDAFKGEKIRVIFRNNTLDMFALGVDDLTITKTEGGTKIDSTLAGNVSVYPTVTSGNVNVATPANATITVMDISGRVLESAKSTGKYTLNMDYANGVYVVAVDVDGRVSTHKVIVKK